MAAFHPNGYITSSCVILRNKVYVNGQLIFENPGGDLNQFLLSVYIHFSLNYPKFYKMDNLCKLGLLASELLLWEKKIGNNYNPHEIGIILANANASIDTDRKYFKSVTVMPSPALFVYTLPNIIISEICIRNKFKGENAFFIFNDFDSGFIEYYVNNLLSNEILQVCICGWVELLDEEYKAVLFLVEKNKNNGFDSFTRENMTRVFNEN
jgi:hypothetical protein